MNKKLLICSWAPPMIGGPQNLYNIFSQYPSDSYCLLTGYQTISTDIGKSGKSLEGKYYYFDKEATTPNDKALAKEDARFTPTMIAYKVYDFTRKIPILNSIFYIVFFISKTVAMTKKGIRIVKDEGISIIIGISDNGPAMLASYFVAKITKLPLAYYMFDIYEGNNLLRFDRLISKLYEARIFKSSRLIIVTNEGTKIYYDHKYNNTLSIVVINNSTLSKITKTDEYAPKPPYKLIFTGHIYWAQEQAILNIIHAVKKIKNTPIQLEIYTPDKNQNVLNAIKGCKNIRLTSAPQSEMPDVQRSATLLILPLSWGTRSKAIIQTATPGKYTDYLSVGRPMLVHAPKYAYVSQYIKKKKLGVVVDENNVDLLAKAITKYLSNTSVGNEYIENSITEFEYSHNAIKNAQKLKIAIDGILDHKP